MSKLRIYYNIYGWCTICEHGVWTYKATKQADRIRATKPGQRMHIDHRFNGQEISIAAVDEFSHYFWLKRLVGKNHQQHTRAMVELLANARRYGHDIGTILSDRENIMISLQMDNHLKGINTEGIQVDRWSC